MKTDLLISEQPEKEFEEFLHGKIKQINNEISPYHRESRKPGALVPLNIILQDEEGRTIGGLCATTYWGWLDIEDFYLPEGLRGTGLGSSILETAESIAVGRSCKSCHLTTFDFQAREFYEKKGFYIVGQLKDYPPGSTYYWMRKDFPG